MATSIGIERGVETTARLTDLIEPAHRIAHDRPRSEVDDRGGAAANTTARARPASRRPGGTEVFVEATVAT
jgi:hypothetical protein